MRARRNVARLAQHCNFFTYIPDRYQNCILCVGTENALFQECVDESARPASTFFFFERRGLRRRRGAARGSSEGTVAAPPRLPREYSEARSTSRSANPSEPANDPRQIAATPWIAATPRGRTPRGPKADRPRPRADLDANGWCTGGPAYCPGDEETESPEAILLDAVASAAEHDLQRPKSILGRGEARFG